MKKQYQSPQLLAVIAVPATIIAASAKVDGSTKAPSLNWSDDSSDGEALSKERNNDYEW